jgi:hypothetical protein
MPVSAVTSGGRWFIEGGERFSDAGDAAIVETQPDDIRKQDGDDVEWIGQEDIADRHLIGALGRLLFSEHGDVTDARKTAWHGVFLELMNEHRHEAVGQHDLDLPKALPQRPMTYASPTNRMPPM